MSWQGMLRKMGIESNGNDVNCFRGKISANNIKTTVVTITNAQIKALRASPKELLPAPGAGKFIEVVSLAIVLNYGSNVLSENAANLQVRYKTSNIAVMPALEMTGFIDQSADQVLIAQAALIATTTLANLVNKAIELQNNGAGEYGGNAGNDTTLSVIINYRVHDDTV